jgi:hypothetical protein
VVAAAAFIAVLLLRDTGNAAEQQRAQAVYCLSSGHRAAFLEAATNLKIAQPVPSNSAQVAVGGTTLPLLDWRDNRAVAGRFSEACAAYAAATKGPVAAPPSGNGSTVVTFALALATALVPVGLTSWLNYRTAARRDAEALRRARTDALRAAALRFVQAADAYLAVRSQTTNAGTALLASMHERRLDLVAALAPIIAASARTDRARALRTRLESELRGDVVGRVGKIDEDVAERIRAKVQELANEAESIADEHADGWPGPGTITVSAGNTQVTRS